MSIKIYVTDDEKNETMECTFTDDKVTFALGKDTIEVTDEGIINDMTLSIIETLEANIKCYCIAKAIKNGQIKFEDLDIMLDTKPTNITH